jgi:outer membrane protein OmpA-like peptidoglycan-associated protein
LIALFALLLSAAPDANLSLLRPASGSDGLLGVEGARPPSETAEPLQLQLGFEAGYKPVRLGPAAYVDSRLGGWLQLAAPLNRHLSVFALLPVTLQQSGDISALGASQPSFGFTVGDVRLGARHGFLAGDIDLAGQLALEFNTAGSQSLTGDGRIVGEALLSAGRRRGDLELLGNLFLRLRPPRDVGSVKVGNEIGLRGGAAWWLSPRSRLYGELEVQASLREFSQQSTPAEWRAGATLCPSSAIALDLAGGTRLDDGLGAPSLRGLIALRYAPSFCHPPPPRTVGPEPGMKELVAEIARQRAAREKAEAEARLPGMVAPSEQNAREELARSEARVLLPPSEVKGKERAETFVEEDNRDSDGDGVPDRLDNCPFVKGPADNHGCPRTDKQVVAVHDERIEILEKVYFQPGRSNVLPRSARLVDQIGRVLKRHPEIVLVEVQGHTDSRGSKAMNDSLSQARAKAVVAALVKRGIAPGRLAARGYGPSRPVATNDTAQGRERNRRVEFRVIKRRIAGEDVDVEQ